MKYLRSLMQQSVTACKNQAKLIQQFTLSLLYLLIIHIVALLFFFLFRLVLFTSIDYQFPPDIQNNFLMQATAFIKGLWFDNVIACYILLLPLVILWVSIRPTTGIKPLYTTIATVTMNLIVSAAIVLLNPYVTIYISYKIPPFALSVHIPDVSTSIYVEVDSKVLLGLPFCDKAFVR